jgi:hypothetical protein
MAEIVAVMNGPEDVDGRAAAEGRFQLAGPEWVLCDLIRQQLLRCRRIHEGCGLKLFHSLEKDHVFPDDLVVDDGLTSELNLSLFENLAPIVVRRHGGCFTHVQESFIQECFCRFSPCWWEWCDVLVDGIGVCRHSESLAVGRPRTMSRLERPSEKSRRHDKASRGAKTLVRWCSTKGECGIARARRRNLGSKATLT